MFPKNIVEGPATTDKATRPQGQAREKSVSSMLQDSILPPNSRTMFSRAANIIRETSELDGVVIFDASIAGVGGHRERPSFSPRQASTDDPPHSALSEFRHQNEQPSSHPDTSSDSSSTNHRKDREQRCQILGFSCAGSSSVAGDATDAGLESLTEHDLKKLLKSYSSGKIMNFGMSEAMTSSDDSTKEDDNGEGNLVRPKTSKRRESTKRLMDVLKRVAPGVRSLCFLPLWDYERSRWFVGCLFWTTQADRLLSSTLDLVYLKAFGNSVMTELSRLNAIALSKTKTTFAASISHELRSPLHGILGGIEFLQQSDNLDSFQKSMLHSTAICGKTLLDTLNHVMDYAKINEINGESNSRTQILKSNSVRISSRPMKNKRAKEVSNIATPFDLSVVTEEVIEAVFASQSYRVAHDRIDEDHSVKVMSMGTNTSNPTPPGAGDDARRKMVIIILDVPPMDNWMFSMPVGAWRRITMNLFGNALKYTDSGSIRVSLKQAKQDSHHRVDGETKVVLTVKDTGIGMSSDFLANHLYSPFTQENHFSSGVGLGLNIVRQILESVSGNIDLTSDLGHGTEVSVTLSLPGSDHATTKDEESVSNFDLVKKRLHGHTIALVDRAIKSSSNTSVSIERPKGISQLATTVAYTIRDWLDMDVTVTCDTSTLSNHDIVICTEPSFEILASIRQKRPEGGKVPVIIFLAMDAIEAAALRTDVRVTSKESVVEVVSQP
jgi:signal transduction histidine kinase